MWQRILSVRSIVITPADDTETWIKFANLCRKSGRMVLAEKTLNSLLGPDANASQMDASTLGPKAPPAVIYSHLKFMWAYGAKGESLSYLRDFTANLAEDLGMATSSAPASWPRREPRVGRASSSMVLAVAQLKRTIPAQPNTGSSVSCR